MTEDILHEIKKKAFLYAKELYTHAKDEDIKESSQCEAYTSGCIEGIELMLKFMEWVQYNFEFCEEGDYAGFYFRIMGGDHNYDKPELLSLYIKQLNNGKD